MYSASERPKKINENKHNKQTSTKQVPITKHHTRDTTSKHQALSTINKKHHTPDTTSKYQLASSKHQAR
jgi:hypothetical protein